MLASASRGGLNTPAVGLSGQESAKIGGGDEAIQGSVNSASRNPADSQFVNVNPFTLGSASATKQSRSVSPSKMNSKVELRKLRSSLET